MTNNTSTANTFNQPLYWAKWVLVTTLGWLAWPLVDAMLSIVLNMLGMGTIFNADPEQLPQSLALLRLVLPLLSLALVGAAIGGLQWLVLREQIPDLKTWTLFTALGFVLGVFVGAAFGGFGTAFLGLAVGLVQWLVLRRSLNKTGWWPVMNVVSWPLAYFVGGWIGLSIGQAVNNVLIGTLLSFALIGAIIGVVTGAVLLWMLRENRVLLDGLREEAEQAK
jgi:hypothetical protein